MHAFRAAGGVIHYREDGDRGGLPVVFANSLGSDLRVWDAMAAALPKRLRLIRYDKRGHGLSDCPPGPWTIEALADDLAALLDHLEVDRALVVGLSIGGLIAQSLAARRPELVRAMVLMDSAAKVGDEILWNQRIEQVRAQGLESLADGLMQRWFSAAFRANRPEELAIWRNMVCRQTVEGYAGCCAALRDADLRDAARRLSLPVLAMVGDEDGATPPGLVEATADLIAGARFEIVEQAGHIPCVEHPRTCAAMLLSFISEHHLD